MKWGFFAMEKMNAAMDGSMRISLQNALEDVQDMYMPSEDEPYMSEQQLAYFKEKLIHWRDQLLEKSQSTINMMKEESVKEVDLLDQGAFESYMNVKLKTSTRYSKLIHKIDAALERIKSGEYGYCEETGEAIGLRRLEARPIATLSLAAQEWHERREQRIRMRR